MSDFKSYREDAEQLFMSLGGQIRAGNISPQIGNDIEALASILGEIEMNSVMWMHNESTQAKQYLKEAKPHLEQIRSEYLAAQRRSELFGAPVTYSTPFHEEVPRGDVLRANLCFEKSQSLLAFENLDEHSRNGGPKMTMIDRDKDVRVRCRGIRWPVVLWSGFGVLILVGVLLICLFVWKS